MSKRWLGADFDADKHNATVKATRKPFDVVAGRVAPDKPRKYRNQKVEYNGLKFDSRKELKVWQELELRQSAGGIKCLQRQVSFPIHVNGEKIHRVVLDFWFFENQRQGEYARWTLVVADAKSEHTRGLNAWKRAKALFEAAYGVSIREF